MSSPIPSWQALDLLPPFPGVVAHHRAPGAEGLRHGHAPAFHRATVERGEDASSYFRSAGIAACAEANGGLCSFRMGATVALFQSENTPLVDDDALAPSLDLNRELFGDFMGSQPNGHPGRRAKRHAVESTLGSARFLEELEPHVRRHTRDWLAEASQRGAWPLEELVLQLIAHVDSAVPGVLDLSRRPLTDFLASAEYGRVARSYFEIASEVISKVHADALADAGALVPFVRALLTDNFEPLAAAPETNLIRRTFALWERPFSRDQIAALPAAELKELGTVIMATYDTTQLSLLWSIGYLESSPACKRAVLEAVRGGATATSAANAAAAADDVAEAISLLELVVLEAVRLGGSNPTALWRRVLEPFALRHGGGEALVPAGSMMWLDRRLANRDPKRFPKPNTFDPANIRAVLRSSRDTLSSVLSRGRYEINSFSMVNTVRNPRKCPGRLFSVRQQALVLSELYAHYDVTVVGLDLRLRPRSAMPRPTQAGTLVLSPRRAPIAGRAPSPSSAQPGDAA